MRRLIHKLAHLIGWNEGHVECWWEGPKLLVGYRCEGCGRLQHVHQANNVVIDEARAVVDRCLDRTRATLAYKPKSPEKPDPCQRN